MHYEHMSHKAHLSRLPNLSAEQQPPEIQNPSKRGILLVPLFHGQAGLDYIKHHVALSAVWCRKSWLENSDAHDYGIEVKFYVEEKVKDSALPILYQNRVPEDSIIYFDGSFLEGALPYAGEFSTFGTKKMASWSDKRFKDYDWIFDIDSDTFAMSSSNRKLPFFTNFFVHNRLNSISTYCLDEKPDAPPFKTAADLLCRDGKGDTTAESIKDWEERFEALAGPDMLEKYVSPDHYFMCVYTMLTAFPAKHFNQHQGADIDFLMEAARCLCNSEAAISLWHSLGNNVFNIEPIVRYVIVHEHFKEEDIELFAKYYRGGKPFLLHYAHPGIDHWWREGIGAI